MCDVKLPLLIHLGAIGVYLCFVQPSGASAEAAPAPLLDAETFAGIELRPGKFLWRTDVASGRGLDIVVSIPRQMLFVLDDGRLIAASSVSTGRRGHSTPTGAFTVLQKKKKHFSNLYDNAPMPFMQRLTWGGVALHAGHIPGYPASHGCIRLPREFAQQLYGMTRIGNRVVVAGDAFPPMAPLVPSLTEVLLREWQKLHPAEMVALRDAPSPVAEMVAETVAGTGTGATGPSDHAPLAATLPDTAALLLPDQGARAIADSSRP
jgi:hypothetical protein